jgi:uncharacterized protein YjgD (DUF1641 family)
MADTTGIKATKPVEASNGSTTDLASLHKKIDFMMEQMETQRKRQEMRDELVHDMTPAVNDLVKLAIDELDEIGNDFQLEDILYLVKRLLRDIRLLTGMLDQLESVVELTGEMKRMMTPSFNQLVEALAVLDKKGYFTFLSSSTHILDQIVTEFGEEDVRALGDNVVTILKTVRSMTQPQIMGLANNAMQNIEKPIEGDVSTWKLLKEMRNPEVRKGMARMLQMVKAFADVSEAAD